MNFPDDGAPALLEGIARVVAVEREVAWLEPEQTGSCGACSATAACGAKGLGTLASRLEARRFPLAEHPNLRVGERVVVGVPSDALIKAALTAYALPLFTLLGSAALAQWAQSDNAFTMIASFIGLLIGLWLARRNAARLSRKGLTGPRFLRRASVAPSCDFNPIWHRSSGER